PELVPEEVPLLVPEDVPELVPEEVPLLVPEDVPELLPEDVPLLLPDEVPEDVPLVPCGVLLPPLEPPVPWLRVPEPPQAERESMAATVAAIKVVRSVPCMIG
ncbi:MAG: hypothetical protein V4789_10785, partial [Burkholderia gladioli]